MRTPFVLLATTARPRHATARRLSETAVLVGWMHSSGVGELTASGQEIYRVCQSGNPGRGVSAIGEGRSVPRAGAVLPRSR